LDLEGVRELAARLDLELAVRVAQVELDRLRRHEQQARDLAVRMPFGGELRDPALARRERVGPAQRVASRARADGEELRARALLQCDRTATTRQLERALERRSSFRALLRTA